MEALTDSQRGILRHSLGLTRQPRPYRNHFVTGPGSEDWDDCLALVESGHMERVPGPAFLGQDDATFIVTAAGKAEAGMESS